MATRAPRSETATPARNPGKGRGAPGCARPHPDEMDARRKDVERLLLLCWTVWDIRRYGAAKWGVTSRSVDSLALQVRREWAAEHNGRAAEDLAPIRQEHRSRIAMILGQAMQAKQLKTALNAAKLLAELDGLLSARAPQQTDADARHSEDVRSWVDQAAARVAQYGGADALLAADARLVGEVQVEAQAPEPDAPGEADADA